MNAIITYDEWMTELNRLATEKQDAPVGNNPQIALNMNGLHKQLKQLSNKGPPTKQELPSDNLSKIKSIY